MVPYYELTILLPSYLTKAEAVLSKITGIIHNKKFEINMDDKRKIINVNWDEWEPTNKVAHSRRYVGMSMFTEQWVQLYVFSVQKEMKKINPKIIISYTQMPIMTISDVK